MSPTFFFGLLAVALGGAAIATQAPINARLGAQLGDPVAAAAASFLVGFVVLGGLTALRGLPEGSAITAGPWWVWVGGALGAFYVWASIWSVGTLGVLTLVAALVFGQLAAALILDAIGAFGLAPKPVSWTRVAAVLLVGAGLVLSRL